MKKIINNITGWYRLLGPALFWMIGLGTAQLLWCSGAGAANNNVDIATSAKSNTDVRVPTRSPAARANYLAAAVNNELITRREVELYRQGRLYSGVNPTIALGERLSYREALEELIDIHLELQTIRGDLTPARWQEMQQRLLRDYAKSMHLTVRDFVKEANHKMQLEPQEAERNIADTMILQKTRQDYFEAQVNKKFSAAQLSQTQAKMRQLMKPTLKLYTVKDQHYALAADPPAQPTAVAPQPTAAERITSAAQLEQQLKRLAAKPDMLTAFITQHPEIKLEEYSWEEQPLSELPDLLAPAINKLKVGETSAPLQAPNGIHLVTLVRVENRVLTEAMIGGQLPEIPKDAVVAVLQQCEINRLSRERTRQQLRPRSYIQLFNLDKTQH